MGGGGRAEDGTIYGARLEHLALCIAIDAPRIALKRVTTPLETSLFIHMD